MTCKFNGPHTAANCSYTSRSPSLVVNVASALTSPEAKRRFNGDIYSAIAGINEAGAVSGGRDDGGVSGLRAASRLQRVAAVSRLNWLLDWNANFELTPRFARRFHFITQMMFLFCFVTFCCFFFILYPSYSSWSPLVDPACDRKKAIFFAIY